MNLCHDDDRPGEHGAECPVTLLSGLEQSPAGYLLQRVMTLNTALKKGFRYDFEACPADEYYALEVLDEEVAQREQEEQERQRNQYGR